MICSFDISWTEAAGQLGAISINVDTLESAIGYFGPPLGLDEGYVASDNPFGVGGCIDRWACIITGFWQSDIPVPEPGTLALLITGLLSAWLTGGSTMRWTVVAPQSGTTSPARLFAD